MSHAHKPFPVRLQLTGAVQPPVGEPCESSAHAATSNLRSHGPFRTTPHITSAITKAEITLVFPCHRHSSSTPVGETDSVRESDMLTRPWRLTLDKVGMRPSKPLQTTAEFSRLRAGTLRLEAGHGLPELQGRLHCGLQPDEAQSEGRGRRNRNRGGSTGSTAPPLRASACKAYTRLQLSARQSLALW